MYDKNQNGTTNAQLTVDDVKNSDLGFDELTEEQFENATDAVIVRSLIEMNERSIVKGRYDVEKIFEIRAGVKPSNFETDTRRVVKIYKIPQGFWYRTDDQQFGYSEIFEVKEAIDYNIISQDIEGFVDHAVNQKKESLEESYEFCLVDDDFELLANNIKMNLCDLFENN